MRARRLAPVAAALVLAACPTAGNHVDTAPLRMRIVPADSIVPGDSVKMTAWLVNPGDQPLRMEFDSRCRVEFYVAAPDRTIVHPAGGGTTCVAAPSTLEVPARDSLRFTDAWLATPSVLGQFTAYAVMWDHHVPRVDGERAFKSSYRSNVLVFDVVAGRE